jgi:cell division protein FtsI/penicillin-binding protein 2
MNQALRRVSLACLVLFLLLLVNANYVQAFEASKFVSDPGNGRTFSQQYQYQRGSIITSDNKTIAESRHVGGLYCHTPPSPAMTRRTARLASKVPKTSSWRAPTPG